MTIKIDINNVPTHYNHTQHNEHNKQNQKHDIRHLVFKDLFKTFIENKEEYKNKDNGK